MRGPIRRKVRIGQSIRIGLQFADELRRLSSTWHRSWRTQLRIGESAGALTPSAETASSWAFLCRVVAQSDRVHWATRAAAERLAVQLLKALKEDQRSWN